MITTERRYEPSRKLASFHIKGFQYWDGALVLDELRVGKRLSIVPEFDNPFDSQAIALYYNDTKLGYIPAANNELFSRMLFYGYKDAFDAVIQKVDTEADPWEQVYVGIFLKDIR